jgi:hypothetical protein
LKFIGFSVSIIEIERERERERERESDESWIEILGLQMQWHFVNLEKTNV